MWSKIEPSKWGLDRVFGVKRNKIEFLVGAEGGEKETGREVRIGVRVLENREMGSGDEREPIFGYRFEAKEGEYR